MENKKKSIVENDIILIYIENQPTFFARIEAIYPDVKTKWWRVKLLILKIPLVVTTWILDENQIRGADFTMDGIPVRIEKVTAPQEKNHPEENSSHKTNHKARILSLNPENE